MRLDRITASLPSGTPLATVVLDATRESETGEQAVLTRWKELRRTLEGQGADGATLDALGERIQAVSRAGGQHGRVLVAGNGVVLLDCALATAPAQDEAVWSASPNVFALARVADEKVHYLIAAVDRAGAELTLAETGGGVDDVDITVDGGHDVLTKVNTGGRSHARFESRAEDSWERNAEAVAAELDRIVTEHHPEVVVVTGDVRARNLVADEVGSATRERLVQVDGGSRGDGAKPEAFAEHVADALETVRRRRRETVLDRYRQEEGRDGAATTGRVDVVEVLRRGQVAELLVSESVAGPPSSLAGKSLWVGEDPLQVGIVEEDLHDLGVSSPRRQRADVVIGRAALAQGAGVTIVPDGSVHLYDGVGAILRWHDAATPAERLYSQSADVGRR